MISFVSGILEHKEANQAVIDVGGVGYEVIIPLSTYEKLPPTGEPVKLYTHYLSRDDEIRLYGFISLDERTLFRTMLTVKGVGPGTAVVPGYTYICAYPDMIAPVAGNAIDGVIN